MPLRLALMVAIGALLALGACSSDTKTVAAPPTTPMTPDPDPDPDPTPDPAAVTLPAGAADAFPTGDTTFTIRSDETMTDDNGNRFKDVNGYRFICTGEDACVVTVTKDADDMLSVETSGMLRRGEVPAVTNAIAIMRFLRPESGNRQQFLLAAGANMEQNDVTMTCPAASTAGCTVVIETRGTGANQVHDVIGTGGVTFVSLYPDFYEGLAYFDGTDGDPMEFSSDLGAGIAGFDAVKLGNDKGATIAHLRSEPAAGEAPASSRWNTSARNIRVDVTATPVYMTGRSGMFAGFAAGTSASDMAKTYGATETGDRRLALELAATAAAPPGGTWATFAWDVELPEKTGDSVAFADALTRSPDSMWTTGFSDTVRLGADTSATDDNGALHYQLFTDFDANKKVDPVGNFGDVAAVGAIAGTVLVVGDDDEVPDAVPDSQSIVSGGTNGTFNGVPGTFVCSAATCTVTTDADGDQTLAGGTLNFTRTPGAQVVEDTDWLAIGSWAVKMDGGATVFGAFFEHAGLGNQSHEGAHQQAQGPATYNGIARGHYAEYNDGARQAGVFAATATFEADFGNNIQDGTGDGEIYGMLRGFSTTEHGMETAADRDAWQIDFGSAASPYSLAFEGSGGTDEAGFTIDASGRWGAEDDNTLGGEGFFKFYRRTGSDISLYTRPTAIAGAFAATSGTNDDNYDLSLVGAIGAKR